MITEGKENTMVILVNENDQAIGEMEKMEAHEKAMLHRAFSIFIFNKKGELLLQRRAFHKYHSGGLWTNTCCSHPSPGEETQKAAERRLREEMGLKTSLQYIRKFTYKASFDNDLTEHETDHIFVGTTDIIPQINPEEVAEYNYMMPEEIEKDMEINPDHYTAWFHIIFKNYLPEPLRLNAQQTEINV